MFLGSTIPVQLEMSLDIEKMIIKILTRKFEPRLKQARMVIFRLVQCSYHNGFLRDTEITVTFNLTFADFFLLRWIDLAVNSKMIS